MSLHRCLVPVADAGALRPIDSIVDYDGPPSWHLEPVDPEERAIWEQETAKPEKVKAERDKHLGYPDFDFFEDHPSRQKRNDPKRSGVDGFDFFVNHPGNVTERRT